MSNSNACLGESTTYGVYGGAFTLRFITPWLCHLHLTYSNSTKRFRKLHNNRAKLSGWRSCDCRISQRKWFFNSTESVVNHNSITSSPLLSSPPCPTPLSPSSWFHPRKATLTLISLIRLHWQRIRSRTHMSKNLWQHGISKNTVYLHLVLLLFQQLCSLPEILSTEFPTVYSFNFSHSACSCNRGRVGRLKTRFHKVGM